jgi:ATP/maltotriose-dependent transcriptional regulator MalT/DNA-binding SARP family transcriptional activator
MHPPLSVSKILPPRFPHILKRPRLLERLERQSDKKLILILGQAAQGKSTLAFSYVNASKVPAAWLNLGPEDSQAVNLFYLLVHSLQQALPEIDLSPLLTYPTLPSGPREELPLYRDWLLTLLNRVKSPAQVVFDGLDRLAPRAAAFRFLQVLLEVAPPHLQLLMLSREMPPLKLQELKVRQEIHVIGNSELAFTSKETRNFLQTVRNLLLPYDLIVQINELTEGWIGGLVLLCETLEGMPEKSREQFLSKEATEKFAAEVSGYFEESIFSSRSPETREFLLKSSILEVVDPDFVKDYLGAGNARDILESLSARNLFVQPFFDKQRGWLYRYHQLFKDFLQAQFKETLPPEQQADEYFRAGSLLEARGDLESAADYYLQAGATDQAVAAIEQVGLQLLKQAQTAELAHWLQNLPPALVQDHPWLLFFHYMTGRLTGAPEYFASLQKAHALFQQQQDVRGWLLTLAHLLDVATVFPHPSLRLSALVSEAGELLQRAESRGFPYESGLLSYRVGFADFFRHPRVGYRASRTAYLLAKEAGDRNLEVQTLAYSHLILASLGEFAAAAEICRQVDGMLDSWIAPEAQTLQLLCSCHLQLFQGEVEQGAVLVQRALELMAELGLTFMYPVALLYRCMSLGYLGRFKEATEVGLELMDLMAPMTGFLGGVASMHLAIFSDHQGDLPAAGKFAAKARQILSRKEHTCEYHLLCLQVAEALISYHLEELDPDTERKLEKTLAEVTGIPSYLLMVEAQWALALWRQRQGRFEEAAAHLQAGMEVAARRGSYYSLCLSPRDRGRIFTLALELEVEEVWDRLPPLLAQLPDQVGPDLARLGDHANPKVAARARELRRGLHRQGLPRLDIRTLGGFRLRRGKDAINEGVWEGKLPKLLLKALIAHGAAEVPKDALLEALWPEGAPEVTEKNFRVGLHRLRKALEPGLDKDFGSSYIHSEDGLLSLDPELCRVDVDEFLSLYESGGNEEEQGNLNQAVALYKKAIALYGGDFLPEEPYLAWAEKRREELRLTYLELLERVSRFYEQQGTLGRAIEYCKKAIQADPLLEPTYRRLMTLYTRRGMRAEALRTYEACRKALARELDTEPDAVTTAIFKKIRESD